MELNAIRNLYNKDCTNDGGVITIEGKAPTAAEMVAIKAEVARIIAEIKANEYKSLRVKALPPIGEQLDMQYWDSVNGTTLWADMIAANKAKHPKV